MERSKGRRRDAGKERDEGKNKEKNGEKEDPIEEVGGTPRRRRSTNQSSTSCPQRVYIQGRTFNCFRQLSDRLGCFKQVKACRLSRSGAVQDTVQEGEGS